MSSAYQCPQLTTSRCPTLCPSGPSTPPSRLQVTTPVGQSSLIAFGDATLSNARPWATSGPGSAATTRTVDAYLPPGYVPVTFIAKTNATGGTAEFGLSIVGPPELATEVDGSYWLQLPPR